MSEQAERCALHRQAIIEDHAFTDAERRQALVQQGVEAVCPPGDHCHSGQLSLFAPPIDSQGNCPACGPWEPMDSVKDAGRAFVNALGEETMMGAVPYATHPSPDVPLSDLRDRREEVVEGTEAINPSGCTDIGSSICEAIDELLLRERPNPKVIVLMSDGRANAKNGVSCWRRDQPANHTRNAAHHADDNGMVIFTIALGRV